jgi:hypothetical protein
VPFSRGDRRIHRLFDLIRAFAASVLSLADFFSGVVWKLEARFGDRVCQRHSLEVIRYCCWNPSSGTLECGDGFLLLCAVLLGYYPSCERWLTSWIDAGSSYEFRLYNSDHSKLLEKVIVTKATP